MARARPSGLYLVGLYLALRLPWLDRIPAYTADEGLLALPAKNWVRFGDPFLDGGTNLLRFPLFTTLLAALYRVLPVTILVGRGLSVAAGAASLWVLWRITQRHLPGYARSWACLLYVADYVLIRYQRYGLAESLQLLFLLLAVQGWLERGLSGRIRGGVALGLALCTKLTSAAILPALLCHDVVVISQRRLWSYPVALLFPALAYGILAYSYPAPFREAWGIYARAGQPGILDLPRLVLVLAAGSPFAIVGAALSLRTARSRPQPPVLLLCAAWLVGGLAVFLLLPAHPVRYCSTLLPAAAILAAAGLEGRTARQRSEGMEMPADPATSTRPTEAEVSRQRSGWFSRSGSRRLARLVVVWPVLLAAGEYLVAHRPDTTARDVASFFRDEVDPGAVVMGRAHLGIDLPQRYIDMTLAGGIVPTDSLLAALGIDYLLVDDGEWRAIDRKLKGGLDRRLVERATLLRRIGSAEVWLVGL